MKHRNGFVSNSSSSSFIVAIKKGYTWEQLIADSGPFSSFAKDLADWLAKECPKMQSLENFAMMLAIEWEGEEYALEAVQSGSYDGYTNKASSMVSSYADWFFGYGDASYNEAGDAIEWWLGNGGQVDGENFKIKRS